jgi:hypothetical protein
MKKKVVMDKVLNEKERGNIPRGVMVHMVSIFPMRDWCSAGAMRQEPYIDKHSITN